jgi:hypothetical protein
MRRIEEASFYGFMILFFYAAIVCFSISFIMSESEEPVSQKSANPHRLYP